MAEPTCRYDRDSKTHLTRAHLPACASTSCKGCLPCTHEEGNPVRHCRTKLRCTSHLGWTEHTCPECLGKIRGNLTAVIQSLALMPAEAEHLGINSEPANLAGPHADYVTAQWRLINADRAGQSVEELDMADPYTCLTMHERCIREELGHDEETLVSATLAATTGYLAWVLTDLARTEDGTPLLTALLGDTSRLKAHLESALSNGRTPERGAPCPVCVDEMRDREADLIERKVPKDDWPKLRAERLNRIHGHWCTKAGCDRLHYLDDSGDVWRCPVDPEHEWTQAAYTNYVEDRRATRRVS